MATTDYGSDISCVSDLDPNLTVVSGPLGVIQAVVRRLQTPRGFLWYDKNYGTDLRAFLNGKPSKFRIAQAIESEALKEERVQRADATVTITTDAITVELALTLAEGTFDLTISVTALTVELISFAQAA